MLLFNMYETLAITTLYGLAAPSTQGKQSKHVGITAS